DRVNHVIALLLEVTQPHLCNLMIGFWFGVSGMFGHRKSCRSISPPRSPSTPRQIFTNLLRTSALSACSAVENAILPAGRLSALFPQLSHARELSVRARYSIISRLDESSA